jgi:hypothetical protein
MVKVTIKLAIVALIAHALFQVAPPYYTHWQLRDALQELATYPKRRESLEQFKARASRIAQELDVDLAPADFDAQLAGPGHPKATIATSYEVEFSYLPFQPRTHRFEIAVVGQEPRLGAFTP